MWKYLPLTTSLFIAASLPAGAEQLYKWVDEEGVTHYGDSVPAEYATRERQVLNEQGVRVKTLPRQKTAEELEAERLVAAELERQRQVAAKEAERDQILLDTYLSVEEIAMLRDRRLLALDAQIGVTRHYLNGLQSTWEELETEARKYNFPYAPDSELDPLPDDIAQHIIHTEKAMAEHMQTIQSLRREQANIRAEFAKDMERFKELTASIDDGGQATQP